MTDWEQLREAGHHVSPPAFESLVSTAGKRDRRARAIVAAATVGVLTVLGVGIGLANDDDDGITEPAQDPSPSVSVTTESPLPDGVLALPPEASGSVSLDAGRYHVPLSDTLAFEVDLPQDTEANSGGLYLVSDDVVLKVEVAGEAYGVAEDPCRDGSGSTRAGTVDDLVAAIRHAPIYRVSRPEPVELDGAEGTRLELRIPVGYDATSCDNGQVLLPGNPDTRNDTLPGHVGYWWILDVDGELVVARQICNMCNGDALDRTASTIQSITFTSTP